MKLFRRLLVVALTLVPFAMPYPVKACPSCQAAAASKADYQDDDENNFPAAMNFSIQMMLLVTYGTLLGVGYLIYRGARKNQEYLDARAAELTGEQGA